MLNFFIAIFASLDKSFTRPIQTFHQLVLSILRLPFHRETAYDDACECERGERRSNNSNPNYAVNAVNQKQQTSIETEFKPTFAEGMLVRDRMMEILGPTLYFQNARVRERSIDANFPNRCSSRSADTCHEAVLCNSQVRSKRTKNSGYLFTGNSIDTPSGISTASGSSPPDKFGDPTCSSVSEYDEIPENKQCLLTNGPLLDEIMENLHEFKSALVTLATALREETEGLVDGSSLYDQMMISRLLINDNIPEFDDSVCFEDEITGDVIEKRSDHKLGSIDEGVDTIQTNLKKLDEILNPQSNFNTN